MSHKKLASHLPHYFSLFGILIAGLIGMSVFSYSRSLQAGIAVSVAIGYVTWGVVHHLIHKDFYPSVFIEYLSVALLGLAVMLSLIYWV